MIAAQFVVKRDGEKQEIKWHKIQARLQLLANGFSAIGKDAERGKTISGRIGKALSPDIAIIVSQRVVRGVVTGVQTRDLDLQSAALAIQNAENPDYAALAARIMVSNLHKETPWSFSEAFALLALSGIISETKAAFVANNAAELDAMIVHERDYLYDYFAINTLIQDGYLKRANNKTVERPQYALMRDCVQDWDDLPSIQRMYTMLSTRKISHATPKRHNACTNKPQLASCFLLACKEDSISGIYDTLKQTACISKFGGGVGVHFHDIRSKGARVWGTDGVSCGLVSMLKVFEATANYVNQGGKRKGSFAIYIEPWHADVRDVLKMGRHIGDHKSLAPDLFYALWVPDLFMKRVLANASWTFFNPQTAPGLADVWGDAFEALYVQYEQEGRGTDTMRAAELMHMIVQTQIEVGKLYLLFKDHVNRKNNQQNLGTIRSSNLCCEIVQYSSPEEVAVCNLGSINLKHFVVGRESVDYGGIREATRALVRSLNKSIDGTYYPVQEAQASNLKHRPMGIGVAGLCDVFMLLRLPYESAGAREVNARIFEHMYQAALDESCRLAERDGAYASFQGSPASHGILQFHMWNVTPTLTGWEPLIERIKKHGLRNSLLIALMPTATTSRFGGSMCESIDPPYGNVFKRTTLSGDYTIINPYLVEDLMALNIYDEQMIDSIINANGSVLGIERIPENVRHVYKTAWEIPLRVQLQYAADRGAFVDQACSQNVYLAKPDTDRLWKYHREAWRYGLKTSSYYVHSQVQAKAIKFTRVNQSETPSLQLQSPGTTESDRLDSPDSVAHCESCSL